MNVGEGLDVSVDVDVNEPVCDCEGEEDRKGKSKRKWLTLKRRETTRLTGRRVKTRDEDTQTADEGISSTGNTRTNKKTKQHRSG